MNIINDKKEISNLPQKLVLGSLIVFIIVAVGVRVYLEEEIELMRNMEIETVGPPDFTTITLCIVSVGTLIIIAHYVRMVYPRVDGEENGG